MSAAVEPTRSVEPGWVSRSLDRYLAWGLVFMAVLVAAFPLYRLREPDLRRAAARDQQVSYTRIGGDLFERNCSECHGQGAVGDEAPTLRAKEFLSVTTDPQIHMIIAAGVPGTDMDPWNIDLGGPLTDQQIDQIVTYLRSLEAKAPSVPNWRDGRPSPEG